MCLATARPFAAGVAAPLGAPRDASAARVAAVLTRDVHDLARHRRRQTAAAFRESLEARLGGTAERACMQKHRRDGIVSDERFVGWIAGLPELRCGPPFAEAVRRMHEGGSIAEPV